MKISYNLLKQFVDFELSPKEIASMLTSIGIEASVLSQGCGWTDVVTVNVLDVQKHPGADKLSLCKVSDGTKEYSIVCGAKNIAPGQTVPLAKIGAVLPGNFEIKKSKIRGVDSEGMICSEKELGLKEESEGIFVLDRKTKIGLPLEKVFGDIDSVLEIEITTNRGDCLSNLGIAREIGAKLRKVVSVPQVKVLKKLPVSNCVEIKSNLCKRYIGSIISGVKVGASPKWLVDILAKSGIRSINNIVDITNFVMIELGQPLHAFDLNKLSSKNIIVREVVDLEKRTALDGKEYKLEPGMLIISDKQKPVAIAGVMGGEFSGVDDKTNTIFLESAIFDAASIRKTSKKLNLSSDSSYRFERGLSWDIAELALWRAANLITEIAGGKQEALEDLSTVKYEKTKIALRVERVSKILGYTVEEDEIGEILRFLGIDLQPKGEVILCTIPSWRNDIKIEVDLIEEIVRIKGYDTIPTLKTHTEYSYTPNNSFLTTIVEEFRTKLNGLGFSEALNCSFLEVAELEKFGLKHYYKIANPISKENEILRPSLLPGLFKNLILNISQGAESIALFEHGKIFTESGERKTFSTIMYGSVWHEWWKWTEQKVNTKFDFYFGGGIIKNILPSEEFMIVENLKPSEYFHLGKTASILFRGKVIGQFGILKPSLTSDIKDEVFYFEMDLESVENLSVKKTSFYKAYSKFPAVKRDISITADKSLQFEKIEKVIKSVMKSGGILKDYSLFSVYNDEAKLGEGKISYSFRLSYKNDEKTLSDKEVNDDVIILLNKLDSGLGVKLRQQYFMIIKKDKNIIQNYFEDNSGVRGSNADFVAVVEKEEDIPAFLKDMSSKKIPVTVAGALTANTASGLAFGGAVLSLEKLNKICEIKKVDNNHALITVQAGARVSDIKSKVSSEGWLYPPDPTEKNAFIGGNIATNASGGRGFKFGVTRDYIVALKVAFSDGSVAYIERAKYFADKEGKIIFDTSKGKKEIILPNYILPNIKNAAGYYNYPGADLIDILIGSEGTLCVFIEAVLKLIPHFKEVFGGIIFFDNRTKAYEFVKNIKNISKKTKIENLKNSISAMSLEYFDKNALFLIKDDYPVIPANVEAGIMFEQDVYEDNTDMLIEQWVKEIESVGINLERVWFASNLSEMEKFRVFRHKIPEKVNEIVKKNKVPKVGTDFAVPEGKLSEMIDICNEEFKKVGVFNLTFGHIGENHFHANIIPANEKEYQECREMYVRIAQKVVDLGGTVSAEHGIGKLRHVFLEKMLGKKGFKEMAKFKKSLDEHTILGIDNIFPKKYLKENQNTQIN